LFVCCYHDLYGAYYETEWVIFQYPPARERRKIKKLLRSNFSVIIENNFERKGDKQMKKIIILFMAIVTALCLSVPAFAAEVATADLITGGGNVSAATDVGDLSVDHTAGDITVSFTIDPLTDWEIAETHVYVDAAAPTKHSPGRFPYVADEPVPVPDDTTIYIAAHAEIMRDTGLVDEYDQPIYEYESVWAQTGDDILFRDAGKGNKWATYFTYTTPAVTP
jgi:hypothetical protein